MESNCRRLSARAVGGGDKNLGFAQLGAVPRNLLVNAEGKQMEFRKKLGISLLGRNALLLGSVVSVVAIAWGAAPVAKPVAQPLGDFCANCANQAPGYTLTSTYPDPNVVWFETFSYSFGGDCVWDELNCCVPDDANGCGMQASGYWQRNPPLGATSRTYSKSVVAKCGTTESDSDGDLVGKLTVFADCADCPDCD